MSNKRLNWRKLKVQEKRSCEGLNPTVLHKSHLVETLPCNFASPLLLLNCSGAFPLVLQLLLCTTHIWLDSGGFNSIFIFSAMRNLQQVIWLKFNTLRCKSPVRTPLPLKRVYRSANFDNFDQSFAKFYKIQWHEYKQFIVVLHLKTIPLMWRHE